MLTDKYLPDFHIRQAHEIIVKASAESIWPFLDKLDFGDSRVIRFLFALRGLPGRATNADGLHRTRFIRLEQIENREMLTGLIGRFWRPRGDLIAFDPSEFLSFDQAGYAKGVWSFELTQEENGFTRVVTETRVFCTDEKSRKKFARYWFFVRPFSGIVRKEILKALKKKVEASNK